MHSRPLQMSAADGRQSLGTVLVPATDVPLLAIVDSEAIDTHTGLRGVQCTPLHVARCEHGLLGLGPLLSSMHMIDRGGGGKGREREEGRERGWGRNTD